MPTVGDLRVGANMDLIAEARDFGADMNRQVLDLREVEVSLESQINPWLYGMIFLTRPSDEDISVEEAAVIADLGRGFRLKAGKYRNEFGLLNTVHEPERPQVSLPLPVEEFLGEEQLRETAVTLGRLTDLATATVPASAAPCSIPTTMRRLMPASPVTRPLAANSILVVRPVTRPTS